MHLSFQRWKREHPLTLYPLNSAAHFMYLAFAEAERGWFAARPNPMVGCVLVHQPTLTIVGKGFHACYGQAHAEVNALQAWKHGSYAHLPGHEVVAYITLEPCSHTGKTPPCCVALAQAGIRRVVMAMQDPHTRVSGKGAAYLQAQGIDVQVLSEFQEANQALNAPFFWGCYNQRPYITVKIAQTLDAALATRNGHSQWISSAEALAWVHTMRGGYDAIISTSGTVLHDTAQLTVRSPQHSYAVVGVPPIRIVLDRSFKLAKAAKHHPIFNTELAPTLVCVDADMLKQHTEVQQQLEACGVTVIGYNAFAPNALSLLLQQLYQLGIRACWVEGGAKLLASLRYHQLWNELYVVVGAKLLLDPLAQRSVWLPHHANDSVTGNMHLAHPLQLAGVEPLGNDALLRYLPH